MKNYSKLLPILLAVLISVFAPGIFTLLFPPSFGASFWDDKANFEFKSQRTAEEFLQLNGDAVALKSEEKDVSAVA